MFTRKPRLQLEKFAINGAKRLLQHNRHEAAVRRVQNYVRFLGYSSPEMLAVRLSHFDLACVKTHTSAKCKKYNSPARRCAARPQHDLTLNNSQFLRDILRARPLLEFSHRQDPSATLVAKFAVMHNAAFS